MKKLAPFILAHRKAIILVIIVLTLVLGYCIKDLRVDPDIINYLPDTDPVVKLSSYINQEYGGNLLAMVALENPDLFTPAGLQELAALTSRLEQVEGVLSVTSLTNILDIKGEDGFIEIGPAIELDYLPATPAGFEELKTYLLSKKLYRGKLLSEDATTTLLICRLQDDTDQVRTTRAIIKAAEEMDLQGQLYYGGLPFYQQAISETILGDLKILTPVVSLLIILTLYLSFRTLNGVILPLLSVLVSAVWTLGLMSLVNVPLTIITDVIPVILIAVGSAYGIHVLNSFYQSPSTGNAIEQAGATLQKIGIALLLAAVTTIAGFVSFVFGSYLTMIQQFGLFAALGVGFALITAATLVPALLTWFSKRSPAARKPERSSSTGARFGHWLCAHRTLILVIGLILSLAGLTGIPRIQRKVEILDYFKPGTPIRQAEEQIMNEKFGGSIPIQILVRGEIQEPAVLYEMQKVQDFLQTLPHVHNPFSIVDLLCELNAAMDEGWQIPDHQDKVANLWFLIEGEEIVSQLVNAERTEALIQANLNFAPMDELTGLVDRIETFLQELDSPVCTFAQTGLHSIYKNLDHSLLQSQLLSLLLSLGLVLIMISLLVGSLRGGIIGLVPIIFTLVIIYGFMGYTGIPLDIATVLVAGVSIGIGIDYAIHFLNRFRQEIRITPEPNTAIERTLQTTGRGIIINVLTVAAGFLVFLFAELVPLQRFGALVALTMLSSGFATLVILPALILFLYDRTNIFSAPAEPGQVSRKGRLRQPGKAVAESINKGV